jgi:hypothetical protein
MNFEEHWSCIFCVYIHVYISQKFQLKANVWKKEFSNWSIKVIYIYILLMCHFVCWTLTDYDFLHPIAIKKCQNEFELKWFIQVSIDKLGYRFTVPSFANLWGRPPWVWPKNLDCLWLDISADNNCCFLPPEHTKYW